MVGVGDDGVRLDVTLMHRLRRERALDDDVGIGKSFVEVAPFEHLSFGDVCRTARLFGACGDETFVQDGRFIGHCRFEIEHVWKYLVGDLDGLGGSLGEFLRRCGNRGEGVTAEQYFAASHDLLALEDEVGIRLAECVGLSEVGEIFGGDDGPHAFHLRRRGGVDGTDVRVGVRRPEDETVQHSG